MCFSCLVGGDLQVIIRGVNKEFLLSLKSCFILEQCLFLVTRLLVDPRKTNTIPPVQAIASGAELVCIHDSARPLVLSQDIKKV